MHRARLDGCARQLTVVDVLRRTTSAGGPCNKLVRGPGNQLKDIAKVNDQRAWNVHDRQLLRNSRVREMAESTAVGAVIVGVVGCEGRSLREYETAKSKYGQPCPDDPGRRTPTHHSDRSLNSTLCVRLRFAPLRQAV